MTSVNTIDKFGRKRKWKDSSQFKLRESPISGYKLTSDGNYDLQGKRLTNVSAPTDLNDAVNQEYILSIIDQLRTQITSSANRDINHFFEQTFMGFDEKLNILDERIIKSEEKFKNDAVNQEYVLSIIDQLRIQLTNLINREIKHYFEQKHSAIEKKINALTELVKKNEKAINEKITNAKHSKATIKK